ncbi:bifunctional 5-dehydro-2-deoxygluconokinase/5-dehydro-2-deoxyphosphogluconate aldolase [Woeseia oceani]|uniref:5-dehydro-2-deoxygluconokinase n=1 Tax=Woeseia oceani TaxID=1548547 RepID=A0A193LDN4_9GAMM|nr:5-dehydro-2-deoxygluconokinase [Woeseia oceani]ANO50494.1 5-dehydro-2-deoxygluconokinase [Woeseia oceani]
MVAQKTIDVICLGRAAVDLYGQQVGCRLEDVNSFAKYLGGSSGNIAYGAARLGLKSAMLTRVGDEHMGRFVREELARGGVDVSHVVTDPQRLTGLAILGIKDRDTFPLVFYRDNCADMAIAASDFSPEFIGSSKALLITGTHFSTPETFAASSKAIEYARAANTKVVVDIDYRPVLWGLTGRGDGETRFVSSDAVSQHLQSVLPDCDLLVGTEEEIHIAGGTDDTIEALKKIRSLTDALIVLKLGKLGCTVLDGAIPGHMKELSVFSGVEVEVLNVLGAGDAFMAGFLRGWLRNEPAARCQAYANACGALVVSRHGCAPAIPSAEELDYYLEHASEIPRPDRDAELNYLHRVTNRSPKEINEICALAFDHRVQLHGMARAAGADTQRIPVLKSLLVRAVKKACQQADLNGSVGIICDDTYGQDALNEATGRGWWIARPVEVPASHPLELEGGRSIGDRLKTWPLEHVVKCLVYYNLNDEPALRLQQERQIKELYSACCTSGHTLLLEIIPASGTGADDDILANILTRMYNLDIRPDWWKLPCMSRAAWQNVSDVIKKRAPHCRGVVLLGLDAPVKELQAGFNASAGFDICKGFTVGRSLFSEPSRQWFSDAIDDEEFVDIVAANYLNLVGYWRNRTVS